jgi:hypothetical protein
LAVSGFTVDSVVCAPSAWIASDIYFASFDPVLNFLDMHKLWPLLPASLRQGHIEPKENEVA